MDEIIAERSGSILRVELNRPSKRNAMTSRNELAPAANQAVEMGQIAVDLRLRGLVHLSRPPLFARCRR